MRALRVPTKCLCSILLCALVAVMTPRATQAALLDYALTVSGFFSANGTIGFDDFTGSGPADPDFANFSLTLTSIGGSTTGLPFTFTKSMVTALDWSIDPTTFALQLDLDVATQTVGAFQYDISLDSIPPSSPSVTCGGSTGIFNGSTAGACVLFPPGVATFASGDLTATRIASVPEPGILTLLGVALLGFAVPRYLGSPGRRGRSGG
jgi:hypothetical protein